MKSAPHALNFAGRKWQWLSRSDSSALNNTLLENSIGLLSWSPYKTRIVVTVVQSTSRDHGGIYEKRDMEIFLGRDGDVRDM